MIRQNSRPFIVTLFLIINVVIFLLWQFWSQSFMLKHFAVSPLSLQEGRYWTLITSVFSHQSFLHFIINMYVFKSFGSLLERMMGSFRFALFFLFAGFFGSVAHCYTSLHVMNAPAQLAVGASGAVAGLILVFSLIFPKEKLLFFGLIPIPAIFGAFAFMGLDLWGLFAQSQGGGLPIGHGAHLGGAFAGLFFFFVFIKPKIKKIRNSY